VALFPVQFQQELLGIAADRFLAGQLRVWFLLDQ
jgi:hypothetical protein